MMRANINRKNTLARSFTVIVTAVAADIAFASDLHAANISFYFSYQFLEYF